MKPSAESDRWLAAGIALAKDRAAKVPCPVCQQADLSVVDAWLDTGDRGERYMFCPKCGARNVIMISRKHEP